MVLTMQSNGSIFLTFIFNLLSLLGHTLTVTVVLVIYVFFARNKLRAITHLLFLSVSLYLMALLKQTHAEPRPFWTTQKVQLL